MQTTLMTLVLGVAVAAPGLRPAPGDPAPPFELAATTGGRVSLSDFVGKQKLVLAFFPKAFTSG